MFTDRDFYRPIISSALDEFGAETLSVLLNVATSDVMAWAAGRARPPTHQVLQIIDLMRRKEADDLMSAKRTALGRVLVATSPAVRNELAGILGHCPVDFACSLEDGIRAVQSRAYSHAVIGCLFAESQMFEFAQQVRRLQPGAQVLCVKGVGRPFREEVRRGLDAAAREIGCSGFYDLTSIEDPDRFDDVFGRILEHFPSGREPSAAVIAKLRDALHNLREMA